MIAYNDLKSVIKHQTISLGENQDTLAHMYETGEGAVKDPEEAVALYKKAIENDYLPAIKSLLRAQEALDTYRRKRNV